MLKMNMIFKLFNMRKFLLSLLVLSLCLLSGAAFAISADDFIPPVQAKAGEQAELLAVKDEAAVETVDDPDLDVPVIQAANLQDAINKIAARTRQGCEIVYLSPDGGATFVATGQGSYKTDYENVIATRMEQRQAYVEAFMNAKAEMAQTTGELVIRGMTDFDKKREKLVTPKKKLNNIETELSESQKASVRKVLKGYVTYAVKDDEKKGRVFVTIVSSPKTRGKNSRMGTDGIVASNLHEGLNGLLAEIQNNLVPPVGGRIITVPDTGETAWVGFGSAVVDKDDEADVQAELDLEAEQTASLRALDALAGIILGDDTRWQGSADSNAKKLVNDFNKLQNSDQSAKGTPEEIQAYETRKREMRSVLSSSNEVHSLRQGTLPPGIMRRTFMDDKEYFAYGIAVYIPSVTQAVSDASREIDDANIVQPIKTKKAGKDNDMTFSAPASQPDNTGQAQPKRELKLEKGPTGIVEQDL